MYEVLVNFTDLQDNNFRYHAGDNFPRKGITVSEERLHELLTDENRRHKPMIKEVKKKVPEETPEPEKTVEKPKKGGKKKDAK